MAHPDIEDQMITKVEAQQRKPHRYNIYINDQFAFSAHEDIIVKFRLVKGRLMTGQMQEEILVEEERNAAYRMAIRYIGRSMRTAREVRDKLTAKGYSTDIISTVIRRMIEERLVDDEYYASALARQRLRSNKKGSLWIKRELTYKGIDKPHVEQALSQFDKSDEKEQAWELAAKRWNQTKGEPIERIRKIVALLHRRGFTSEAIRSATERLRKSTFESGMESLEELNDYDGIDD